MTNQYPIVSLNNELYMYEDKEIRYKGECIAICLHELEYPEEAIVRNVANCGGCRLILASTDKSLNLPLLPAIQDNYKQVYRVQNPKGGELGNLLFDVQTFEELKDAEEFCKGHDHLWIIPDFIVSSSAKKWSEEDMRKAILMAKETVEEGGDLMAKYSMEDVLQSLQDKPIAVEVQMEKYLNQGSYITGNIVTDLRLEVDENNFVKVVKWIYEND